MNLMDINVSNFLSILRAPLALLLMIDSPFVRATAIFLAMVTDCLDGYIARRYKMTTQLGAVLDPLMDKFFVFFALAIFLSEGRLELWQALSLLSRDAAVLLFGCYLGLQGHFASVRFRSIWSGKLMTTLQFFVLFSLTFRIPIPANLFFLFFGLGLLALIELYTIRKEVIAPRD